ncbi:MAG: sigma 54-interacting transcriptional regulator, partial [Tissierellales bacterium]
MIKSYEDIPKLFKNIDFFLITDNKGYIKYYEVINSLGTRIVENPVGLHILELHQHLNEKTSTVMKALRTKEPIINEKQYLNIFKERTVTILATSIPLICGNEAIGVIEIDRYLDEDLAQYEEEDFNNEVNQNNYFFTIDDIITNDPAMINVKNQALKAAKTNSPVMIYGETGTGKELIAQAIHNHSFRKNNPFIVQNCA